jgi:phosphomannomutase/phosphoglucomutase
MPDARVEPKIFREYDIRGVWGSDLTIGAVRAIARAYTVYLRETGGVARGRLSVGYDARLSSPEISAALCEELSAAGHDVLDIGMVPTPLQYFSLHHHNLDGGIMITGSHNPAEFNGLKLSVGKETIYGAKIQAVRKLAEEGARVTGAAPGTVSAFNIIPEYMDYVVPRFKSLAGLKVVVDAGNGTGGIVAPEMMRRLGAEVVEIFCDPDGRFPNHHPDPVVLKNLTHLIAKVKETGAHVGIGLDGDADRIGVVDHEGRVIWGDSLMIILARSILKAHPGTSVIGEVKCSQTLYDDIARHGGIPIMWKTGHSLIKSKMKESGALLAGEMSGHIFFADRWFGFDDAPYAALRLLEIMHEAGEPYDASRLLAGVPATVSTPEIRVDCPDEVKFSVAEKMQQAFKDYDVVTIDGARINFPEGWGLIRASNTQPALVLRFEATDAASLQKIRDAVEGELKKITSA